MKKIVTTLLLWDQRIVSNLVPQRSKSLNRCMTVVTMLGDGWLYIAVSVFLLFTQQDPERLFFQMSVALALQVAIHIVVKQTCSRPRPFELLKNVPCIIDPLDRYSFPSGHTAAAFVIVATVGVFHSYLFLPLFLLGLLIGFSRIYLGVHYPSDVLAGGLLGITSGGLARWLLA